MSFWEKMKESLRRFMQGRNGSDELSLALLITALVCTLLSGFGGLALLNLLGMVAYVLCVWRMFSRKVEKRYAENQKYLQMRNKVRTSSKQV